jgi:hypothetical protein
MFVLSRYAVFILAASFTATAIVAVDPAAPQAIGVRSHGVASTGEAIYRAAGARGGFSTPVKKKKKKKKGTSTKRDQKPRAETSNFNSTIVDSWLMVLSVGTPPQELE